MPDSLAYEPGCKKVRMNKMGDEFSWFSIIPVNRLRQEGEIIYYHDAIYLLSSAEQSENYLHGDTREIRTAFEKLEVNASGTPTEWWPRLYMKFDEYKENALYLSTGNSFRIYHRITEGYLTVTEGGSNEVH